MAEFDDILADLKVADADRSLPLSEFISKYPEINSALIRRKVYNQKLDEIDAERKTRATDLEELEGWRKQQEHWDADRKKWKWQIKLESDLAASEAQRAALQKAVEEGGEMNFDQVLDGLKERGFVTKADLPVVVREAVSKGEDGQPLWMKDVDKRVTGLAYSVEQIYTKATPYMMRYYKEFDGAEMPLEEFVNFVAAKPDGAGWKDVETSYKEFTAGKRSQLETEALKKKVAEQEEEIKTVKEKAQSRTQPDDTGSGTPAVMGPLAKRLAAERAGRTSDAAEAANNGKLGDGSAAAAGLKALQEGTLVSAGA